MLHSSWYSKVFPLMSTPGAEIIFELYIAWLIGERRLLKDRGTYFKVTGVVHMKFQNSVILSFPITIDNYHYDIFQNYFFQFFIGDIPVPYAFWFTYFDYGQISNKWQILRRDAYLERGAYSDQSFNYSALIWVRCLFEARRLLEEMS